jgi:hypothetical protein
MFQTFKLGLLRRKLAQGKISVKEAERKAKPFMDKLNKQAAENARNKGEDFKPITFEQFVAVWRAREAADYPNKKQW